MRYQQQIDGRLMNQQTYEGILNGADPIIGKDIIQMQKIEQAQKIREKTDVERDRHFLTCFFSGWIKK